MIEKNLTYYMGLPYRVEIYPEEDGSGYTAVVPDLPGCMTGADTLEEVWEMVEEAKGLWLEVALADGDHIPEPAPVEVEAYSGKFVVRLPRSLHRQLAQRAQLEDTSLNQLVVMLLAEGMGRWRERGGRSSTRLHHYAQTAEPTTIHEPRGGGAAAPSSPEEGESFQREDGEASE
jgi:antitoxin HicB